MLWGPAASFVLPVTTTGRQVSTTPPLALSKQQDTDDPIIQLPLWEARLASCDDAEQIQELKLQIDNAKAASEFGIRKAQVEFYSAFSNQDLKQMQAVWTSSNDCQCVHPGMARIEGIEDILKSWEIIFEAAPAFEISPSDTNIDVCGSTAICTCIETVGTSAKLEAVNIYKREEGAWKITMHIASAIAMTGI